MPKKGIVLDLRDVKLTAEVLRQLPLKAAEFYANGGPGVSQGVVGDRFQGQGNARFPPLSTPYAAWKAGRSKALNAQAKNVFGRGSRLKPTEIGVGSNISKWQAQARKKGLRGNDAHAYVSKRLASELAKRTEAGAQKAAQDVYDRRYSALVTKGVDSKTADKTASAAKAATLKRLSGGQRGAYGKVRVAGMLPILVLTGALRAAVTQRKHDIRLMSGDTAVVSFDGLPDYAPPLHTGTSRMPKRSPVEPNDMDARRVFEFTSRWLSAMLGQGKSTAAFGGGVARIIR